MTIDMVIELIERRYNRCVYKHGKLKESIEADETYTLPDDWWDVVVE